MRNQVAMIWLLLAPSLPMAAGQTLTETLPQPSPLEAPPPRVLPEAERPARPGGKDQKNELALPTCTLAELKENFLKLKTEREALQSERLAAGPNPVQAPAFSDDSARLRLRLGEILARMGTREPRLSLPVSPLTTDKGAGSDPSRTGADPAKTGAAHAKGPETKESEASPTQISRPLDPLALAQAFFKAGNYEASLKTYRLIDLRGMRADERLPIQYMIATCLKRLGKNDDAALIYREIANSRGDEELALCAQWQLSAMRWQNEMQGQLVNIRQRRATLEKR